MIDFEEQIPRNCISKSTESTKSVNLKKKPENIHIEDNIPLLIKDVLTIAFCTEDYKFGENLKLFNINFKTVTIYGNCIQILCPSVECKFKFVIDDGTSTVLVKYPVKDQVLYEKRLIHLKEHYSNSYENKNNVLNSEIKELKDSIKRILNKIENQIKQIRNIKVGDQVSIVGIPYKIVRSHQHYDVCIHAKEINLLTEQSRDKELFFKNNLIYYYKNRYSNKT